MPTPVLPPEILLNIFEHVGGYSRTATFLDLLSCCMVQRLWCECALPLIRKQLPNLYLNTRKIPNLYRKASLIAEATKSAPHIVRMILKASVHIDYVFDINEKDDYTSSGVAWNIAALTLLLLPFLQELELSCGNFNKNRYIHLPKPFIQQILPLGDTLTRITFKHCRFDTRENFLREESNPAAQFISSLVNLESIAFVDCDGNTPVVQAFTALPKLHTAHFDGVLFPDDAAFCRALTSWPNLRNLHLRLTRSDSLVQALTVLRTSPQQLEELSIVIPKSFRGDITLTICNVIEVCSSRLKVLSLPSELLHPRSGSDTRLLAFLARSVPSLEVLDLSGRAELTDTNLPSPQWPRLRVLKMSGCDGLSGGWFVTSLLPVCKKLMEVDLPRWLATNTKVVREMRRRGFIENEKKSRKNTDGSQLWTRMENLV